MGRVRSDRKLLMSVTALIVDDSKAARQVISHYLRPMGCTIAGEAANTGHALRLFRECKPHLVTLDLMMPRILGIDSMALLRIMKREMPEVVVIVVSVVPFAKTRGEFLDNGALVYLTKPITNSSFQA